MLVNVIDYRGNPTAVEATTVIKIRQAGIADEPKDTVFIDYASGGVFAKDIVANIVQLFGAQIRLAALHAPNSTPIYLNADGIAAVETDSAYDGNSVAVVKTQFGNIRVPARNRIALAETVSQAVAALQRAHLTA